MHSHSWLSTQVQGIQTQILRLIQQVVLLQSHLPLPMALLMKNPLGIVDHAYNPTTYKAECGSSLV